MYNVICSRTDSVCRAVRTAQMILLAHKRILV